MNTWIVKSYTLKEKVIKYKEVTTKANSLVCEKITDFQDFNMVIFLVKSWFRIPSSLWKSSQTSNPMFHYIPLKGWIFYNGQY
jgi:hypothetical protein